MHKTGGTFLCGCIDNGIMFYLSMTRSTKSVWIFDVQVFVTDHSFLSILVHLSAASSYYEKNNDSTRRCMMMMMMMMMTTMMMF